MLDSTAMGTPIPSLVPTREKAPLINLAPPRQHRGFFPQLGIGKQKRTPAEASALLQSCTLNKLHLLLRARTRRGIPHAACFLAVGLGLGCRHISSEGGSGHGNGNGHSNYRDKGFHCVTP